MDQTIYHVLLAGRKVGPYDRRTIVGMRIKNALTSDHVLVGVDGSELTVAELIGQHPAPSFSPDRSGSFSVVQATFTAALVEVRGKGLDVPRFKDEVEARVQGGVLRIAGRFRKGLGWKEDRVKLVLKDVVHARVQGSLVDLWLRTGAAPGKPLQRLTLELFTHESAGELVDWMPGATPWPEPAARSEPAKSADGKLLWMAGGGLAVVVVVLVVLILVALSLRRVY
ncbi:MAG: hypothetical protein JWQ07_3154 [Ramlibacter sp.]|nr:hypothetical protein [Ramlibacter sp.]